MKIDNMSLKFLIWIHLQVMLVIDLMFFGGNTTMTRVSDLDVTSLRYFNIYLDIPRVVEGLDIFNRVCCNHFSSPNASSMEHSIHS